MKSKKRPAKPQTITCWHCGKTVEYTLYCTQCGQPLKAGV